MERIAIYEFSGRIMVKEQSGANVFGPDQNPLQKAITHPPFHVVAYDNANQPVVVGTVSGSTVVHDIVVDPLRVLSISAPE
jgi:hypothetical protein